MTKKNTQPQNDAGNLAAFFAELIIPRHTLATMTACLLSRHGRFDPEVVGRMDGASADDIPLRIADYAHGIWTLCRDFAAAESLAVDDLLEMAVMAAGMTTAGEDTAATIRRVGMALKACDRIIREQEKEALRRVAEAEAKADDLDFFKPGDLLDLADFLRPFFPKHSKEDYKIARFREYLKSKGGVDWGDSQMTRHRESGVFRSTALAHKRHFQAFLTKRKSRIFSDRAKTAASAKHAKANETKKTVDALKLTQARAPACDEAKIQPQAKNEGKKSRKTLP